MSVKKTYVELLEAQLDHLDNQRKDERIEELEAEVRRLRSEVERPLRVVS